MNDEWPDPAPADFGDDLGRAPARTVVVRWWCEQPGADGVQADRHTRGDVHELGGATLGIFTSFDALVALLHRLVAEARGGREQGRG